MRDPRCIFQLLTYDVVAGVRSPQYPNLYHKQKKNIIYIFHYLFSFFHIYNNFCVKTQIVFHFFSYFFFVNTHTTQQQLNKYTNNKHLFFLSLLFSNNCCWLLSFFFFKLHSIFSIKFYLYAYQ